MEENLPSGFGRYCMSQFISIGWLNINILKSSN
jgi:hypothetical protein